MSGKPGSIVVSIRARDTVHPNTADDVITYNLTRATCWAADLNILQRYVCTGRAW